MKIIFYYFPYKRFPAVLYRNRSIFETKLFKVFYNMLFPDNYLLRARRDSATFSKIFEALSCEKVSIPNNDIQLIYNGYEKNSYFEFDDHYRIKDNIWHKGKVGFYKEKFLGYPIYYNYNLNFIKNRDAIKQFMCNHWENLKNQKSLHGDFTHMNILINDSKQITAIDEKIENQNSLISDHFYFYAYFLSVFKKHRPWDREAYLKIKIDIENILSVVFQNEEDVFLYDLVESINFDEFCLPEAKTFIDTFKKNVLKI